MTLKWTSYHHWSDKVFHAYINLIISHQRLIIQHATRYLVLTFNEYRKIRVFLHCWQWIKQYIQRKNTQSAKVNQVYTNRRGKPWGIPVPRSSYLGRHQITFRLQRFKYSNFTMTQKLTHSWFTFYKRKILCTPGPARSF